jgi:monofunctional biosynthetic peptidoglycan transglycosylase
MLSKSPARHGIWYYLFNVIVTLIVLTVILVLPWRWLNPPTTAFMLRDALQREHAINYWWRPLERISPQLAVAVIAAEDQKFPQHHGFDLSQIQAVLEQRGSPGRGASTLSQQLAKNLFLWPGRSYLRKGLEAWLTLCLELLLPKQRILELYLNVAEFGPAIYGAGAASQLLFDTSADMLSMEEAALLAAVLPNPKTMSAAHPSDYVRQRAASIELAANQLGGVSYLSKL